MDNVNLDSLFDYLRQCGGQDTLVFDNSVAATRARALIQHQLEEDCVAFDLFPSIDQFDNALRLRLKDMKHVPEPAEQAAKIF